MSARWFTCALLAPLVVSGLALAQAPPTNPGKVDAKSLVESGVKLLDGGDYLGALAVFEDAYERFPSPRILINIGTTLRLLARNEDAANTYQRFLDSPDAPAERRGEVERALAELDATLGILTIELTPPDAELRLDGKTMAARELARHRVRPGPHEIAAHKAGYANLARSVQATERMTTKVTMKLVPLPPPPVMHEPRSRIGVLSLAHVSLTPRVGGAWLVGATVDVTERIAVEACALLGPGIVADPMTVRPPPSFGAYLGIAAALTTGRVRPRVAAGVPMFISDGTRWTARGAVGLEYVPRRQLAFVLEMGGGLALNPEDDIRRFALVTAVGVSGRL